MAATPKPLRKEIKKHEKYVREEANQGNRPGIKKELYKKSKAKNINKHVAKMIGEGNLKSRKK